MSVCIVHTVHCHNHTSFGVGVRLQPGVRVGEWDFFRAESPESESHKKMRTPHPWFSRHSIILQLPTPHCTSTMVDFLATAYSRQNLHDLGVQYIKVAFD